jgi:hypothetical protein
MLLAPERPAAQPETTADINYRIASTREEREAAFRLVYASYLRGGLGDINRYQMRVTPYHLLPTTETFIAEYQGTVIFTMSLVTDGALGLPMESLYGDEIADLRRQGLKVGEISCLADRRASMSRFFPVFLRTSRVMTQYAHRQGLDAVLATVRPKHARFYRRCFDFKVLGGQKEFPTVRNVTGMALWAEFARLRREQSASYLAMIDDPFDDELLAPQPISSADCEYFRPMIDPTYQFVPIGDADEEPAAAAGELAGVA